MFYFFWAGSISGKIKIQFVAAGAVGEVEIPMLLAGFPSELKKSRSWTFPRSPFFYRPLHPQILL
jgi:hypothetical protein